MINTSEQMPACYSEGNWDGLRSDLLIFKTTRNLHFIGYAYEHEDRNRKIYTWCDQDGYEVTGTVDEWYEVDKISCRKYYLEVDKPIFLEVNPGSIKFKCKGDEEWQTL